MKRAFLGLVVVLALAHCAAFTRPGCSEAMPDPDQLLVAFHANPKGGGGYPMIHLDRTGRSYFSPMYTRWGFSSPAECRVIGDFASVATAWSDVSDSSDRVRQEPKEPYLMVYMPDGRRFLVRRSEIGKRPDLDKAVAATLNAFALTYGNRFVREIRALRLQDLRRAAPEDGQSNAGGAATYGPFPARPQHRRSAATHRGR